MVNMNEIKDYLVENGVKPSYHRLKVMEYLIRHRNHPTVDEIYNELIQEMPTLSRTTIYNTLNLFVEENIVIPLGIESNETRYDARVEDHGHFKCEACGIINDFMFNPGEDPDELTGYQIRSKNVFYKGICPKCLVQDKKN